MCFNWDAISTVICTQAFGKHPVHQDVPNIKKFFSVYYVEIFWFCKRKPWISIFYL